MDALTVPVLSVITWSPFVGALLIMFTARRHPLAVRLIAAATTGVSAVLALSRLIGWIDRYLVDGLLNVASAWTLRGGDALRRIQSGLPQDYVYGVAFGVLFLVVWARLLMR